MKKEVILNFIQVLFVHYCLLYFSFEIFPLGQRWFETHAIQYTIFLLSVFSLINSLHSACFHHVQILLEQPAKVTVSYRSPVSLQPTTTRWRIWQKSSTKKWTLSHMVKNSELYKQIYWKCVIYLFDFWY